MSDERFHVIVTKRPYERFVYDGAFMRLDCEGRSPVAIPQLFINPWVGWADTAPPPPAKRADPQHHPKKTTPHPGEFVQSPL